MSKRPISNITSECSNSLSPPPEKRPLVVIEPIKLETIASAEDLDIKILRVKNRRLYERLEQRQRIENELREKIEQLENRKANDDSKLCIVDRYWTQLDLDLRLLLERFDSSNGTNNLKTEISKSITMNETMRNFLTRLIDWDKVEIDDKLKERVKFTTQVVSRLLIVYDKAIQKQDKYFKELNQHMHDCSKKGQLDAIVNEQISELKEENTKLNQLVTQYQEKVHTTELKYNELEDRINLLENQKKELNSRYEECEYQLEKSRDKSFKLEKHLADVMAKLNSINTNTNTTNNNSKDSSNKSNLTDKQLSDLQNEVEQQRELASSRLVEMEKLNGEYHQALKHIEKLKFDLKMIPESVISESVEYKSLLTKYSLACKDVIELKKALEDAKYLYEQTRTTFLRQIEHMESEELANQKRLGHSMMQLEDQLKALHKENEVLRIEYEQNLAANEQTGPINKEMRSLITTLQTNNKLLKSENARTKKRLNELQEEFERYKTEQQKSKQQSGNSQQEHQQQQQNESEKLNDQKNLDELDKHIDDLIEKISSSSNKIGDNEIKNVLLSSIETFSSLKTIIEDHKKQKIEFEETKLEIKRLKEQLEKCNTQQHQQQQKPSDNNDYLRKIKSLEDTIRNKKQEETALLNDMEITGQAYEDMQEQNIRLVQQLREKDDANFKLMSERIKLENTQKLLKEEKDALIEQVATLQEQLDAQMNVCKKLEEQSLLLQQNNLLLEKDIHLSQQACEQFKRNATENAQWVQDLKLHTQKYFTQLKDTQHEISEKTEALAVQSFNNKRLQEEIKNLHSKLERQKKFEMATCLDEVLKEENREYKEQLTCPSCKVKPKDAVLTKCFHVFCYDCLQKRYESRQRKCPKCNANFGANDYRKLYLS